MSDTHAVEPAAGARSARWRLSLAGSLVMLSGLFLAAMGGLSLMVPPPDAAAVAANPAIGSGSVTGAGVAILALAVCVLGLGFSLLLPRRWARALVVVFSWYVLATGVIATIGLLFRLDGLELAPGTPVSTGMAVGMLVALGVPLIVFPAVLIGLLQGHAARRSVEQHDPRRRWTDLVPLPVLGLSTYLLITSLGGALGMFFVGIVPGGEPSLWETIVQVLLSCCGLVLAIRLFKLDKPTWWAAAGFLLAAALVYLKRSLAYQEYLGQLPADQAQAMGLTAFTQDSGLMAVSALLPMVAALVLLVLMRHHFKQPVAEADHGS